MALTAFSLTTAGSEIIFWKNASGVSSDGEVSLAGAPAYASVDDDGTAASLPACCPMSPLSLLMGEPGACCTRERSGMVAGRIQARLPVAQLAVLSERNGLTKPRFLLLHWQLSLEHWEVVVGSTVF